MSLRKTLRHALIDHLYKERDVALEPHDAAIRRLQLLRDKFSSVAAVVTAINGEIAEIEELRGRIVAVHKAFIWDLTREDTVGRPDNDEARPENLLAADISHLAVIVESLRSTEATGEEAAVLLDAQIVNMENRGRLGWVGDPSDEARLADDAEFLGRIIDLLGSGGSADIQAAITALEIRLTPWKRGRAVNLTGEDLGQSFHETPVTNEALIPGERGIEE